MITINPNIDAGSIIALIGVLIGIAVAWGALKNNVKAITTEMIDLKTEMKAIGVLLIANARHEERLLAMDERLTLQGRRIDSNQATIARLEGSRHDETVDRFNRLMLAVEQK